MVHSIDNGLATSNEDVAAVGKQDAIAGPFFRRNKLPIGIQLFPLMPDLRSDFGGTLRKLSAIGYRVVETAGLIDMDAVVFRRALDDAGLVCGGMHVQGKPLFGAGISLATDIERVISEALVLGATDIVMPLFFFPDNFQAEEGLDSLDIIRAAAVRLTADDWKRMAAFLNEKAAVLKSHGLQLSYHNHNAEFFPLGVVNGLDILLTETDPKLVQFECDVGWAAVSQIDVPDLLSRYPGRFTQMHVKDIAVSTARNYKLRQEPALIGSGIIDWSNLLPIAHAAGVRSFFVEQEAPFIGERVDAMTANYQYLDTLGTAQ